MTIYVVMANDYPCGAATTEDGAKQIEKACLMHWKKIEFASGRERSVHIRIYPFQDGEFDQ